MKETYLGDGLYASYDGSMFILRAPREDGDHWVGLEPDVMLAFDEFRQAALKSNGPHHSTASPNVQSVEQSKGTEIKLLLWTGFSNCT